jgi:hypothetical protein
MSPSRRRARGACRVALLGGAALIAACSGTTYDGIDEDADVPRLTTRAPDVLGENTDRTTTSGAAPASTTPTTAAPAPSTPAPSTPAPSTTGTAAPAPATGRRVEPLGATGVRMELPAEWRTEAATDPRPLLPLLAPALAPSGLFDGTRFVATRRTGTGDFAPSVLAFERPRAPGDTATGLLGALRSLVGARAASGTPTTEPSRLGESAYVTYQYSTAVDGTTTEIVSEHYAFLRPTSVLVLTMTTTSAQAAADGLAFGRMLASLSAG